MSKAAYIGVKTFAPRPLPEGYAQVAYVQSSGSQYIDTGFTPDSNTRVTLEYAMSGAYSAAVALFGVRSGVNETNSTQTFIFWNTGSNLFRSDYMGSKMNINGGGQTERQILDMNRNVAILGSRSVTHPVSTNAGNCPLTLFAINEGGTVGRFSAYKLYACKVYDDGALVRDFVPCTNAEGVAGLYDAVSGAFFTCTNGTALAAGAAPSAGSFASVARKIKAWYVGVNGVARKIKKGYVGVNGVARLFLANIAPFAYTGAFTQQSVTVDGAECTLYTLTGSGTLTLDVPAKVWACGGGGGGGSRHSTGYKSYSSGGGGGGGYCISDDLAAGSHIIVIGAGGTSDNAGNATTIGSITTNGGGTSTNHNGGNGGSGGGYGIDYSDSYTGVSKHRTGKSGTGAGISTYPFGLTDLNAHCAGGGGGCLQYKTSDTTSMTAKGGNGGSNGGNGRSFSGNNTDRPKGGSYGGGRGGMPGNSGDAGSFYGAAGGGGGKSSTGGGSGYQGVVYVLIPA